MNTKIKTIGIIGGGQLGMMLSQAAHRLGFAVAILEKELGCPAYLAFDLQKDKFIQGNLFDYNKLLELASLCEVMTFEIEHIDTEALKQLQSETNTTILPSPQILEIINDKFTQKTFLKKAGLPVGDFEQISDLKNLDNLTKRFGFPFLVKSRKGGYDGGGNFVIKTKADFDQLILTLDLKIRHADYFVEKFVPFEREISVLLARSLNGEVEIYPVIDTFQENNACTKTIVPSTLDLKMQEKVKLIGVKIAQKFDYVGVMAIEMFVLNSGEVLINEIAPRVHNSGHWTIDASETSQFEQHIRCITGMELGSTNNKYSCTMMLNVFGYNLDLIKKLQELNIPNVYVYDYGKKTVRPNRKMGHINIVGNSMDEVEAIFGKIKPYSLLNT